jgi:hypothetical protein
MKAIAVVNARTIMRKAFFGPTSASSFLLIRDQRATLIC